MSVYVDNARILYRGMRMCHMVADSLEELHDMASTLGLKKEWFQEKSIPHYDICLTKRAMAVQLGAKEVTSKELVKIVRNK